MTHVLNYGIELYMNDSLPSSKYNTLNPIIEKNYLRIAPFVVNLDALSF